jgi:amino acid adenylation domain-containing protein
LFAGNPARISSGFRFSKQRKASGILMHIRTSKLLHEQFEAQARRTPDAVALSHGGDCTDFSELDARADRIADVLSARGIREGAFVGLHVERSIDYVIALLGILKSNCAVVPLPPSYPVSRLREILDFADLDAVVDNERTPLDPSWTRQVVHMAEVGRFGPTPEKSDSLNADARAHRAASPEQPAFVLCSSGSTGAPKMIVRSHGSFFHRLNWTWEHLPYRAGEVCVQKSHMTTTHAIYELFEPLLRGVPQFIISDSDVRDLESFWDTIRKRGVTRLLIVPSVLRASLDMPGFAAPPLDVMVLMGEHVSPQLAARAVEAFPARTRVFSIYGSTEASSTLVCDIRASLRPGQELPLGQPISTDVQALVLDDARGPVQSGELGMLHISGPALFTSYFRAPERTVEALAAGRAGSPALFCTHDQVRVLPDGQLQFVGRVDDTAKIRGFRVDLKEVERAVQEHPEVRQCTVLRSEDDAGNAALVAFVTPATITPASVFQAVAERLPGYMVPGTVFCLDSFPLTPSGKVDRRKLLDEFGRAPPVAESATYATDTERRVVAVWQEVLGHGLAAPESSFFEVGGTSLTVFAMVHRLRTALSLSRAQLSDRVVYQYPRLSDLAAYIDAIRGQRVSAPVAADPVLATLKRGTDPTLPPMFMIASAGGTLGAYEKLVKALGPKREIIGVRDPFLWGERDATQGFQAWVARYIQAIQSRRPQGPYYITAYSSAGAFGYEIARQLRGAGHEVALLALIDPLAMDRASKWRFGYWALDARFNRLPTAPLVLLAGWVRRAIPRSWRGRAVHSVDWTPGPDQFPHFVRQVRNDPEHIRTVAALLQLGTGLPVALEASELAGCGPDGCVPVLVTKMLSVAPETDPHMLENLVVQYQLQLRSQENYRLRPYDGHVAVFEAAGPYQGLVSAQLAPYVRGLRAQSLEVGEPPERARPVAETLFRSIRMHYLCMRDDLFTTRLARELEALI